jgi:hypothetical protein
MDAALVQPASVRDEALGILSRLGVPQSAFAPEGVMALSPITGELIAQVRITSVEEMSAVDNVRTLKTLAKKKTRAASIAKTLKRTEGATRQKAFSLGMSLDSRA